MILTIQHNGTTVWEVDWTPARQGDAISKTGAFGLIRIVCRSYTYTSPEYRYEYSATLVCPDSVTVERNLIETYTRSWEAEPAIVELQSLGQGDEHYAITTHDGIEQTVISGTINIIHTSTHRALRSSTAATRLYAHDGKILIDA